MNNNIQHPKVVILGAGSLFFGRQAIWQMVHSPHLNKGTLSLVDTNPVRLKKLKTLAEMVIKENNVELVLEASTNRKDVLRDADFVVLSFAVDTVKYRGLDCNISEKYGIRMCSGDTIGPGGIFRALREQPVILQCVDDIKEYCPDAWVINYINPTAVHGIALKRYAPDIKSIALCDSLHMPRVKQLYAERAGIITDVSEYSKEIDQKFDLRIAGVNHFTWVIKASYEGKDVLPKIAGTLKREAATEANGGDIGAKALFNRSIGYELYKIFGYIPHAVAHTKEYFSFWQGLGTQEESVPPLSIWQTAPRYQRHDAMWQQVDDFVSGKIPISEYMTTFGPDHATDIIENMIGDLGKKFYINTFNNGAVSNMADDAFLELLSDIDMNGPRPIEVGDMPRGLRGMQEIVLDTHELTAQAAKSCDIGILRRAMMTDPLINSIADADSIVEELLEVEKEILPNKWYK